MATPITLVFTDVVGSSAAKRDAKLGSSVSARDRAYLESIQTRHLHVVRSAVARHRGKEIMTIGDAFFLTFENPADALRCCAAIQRTLIAEPIETLNGPLRLRIGIHVGTPEFFEGSWHGTDVDIAARAQSAASAGQVVLTGAARQAVGDAADITLRFLGTFALKGVGDVPLWDADYAQKGIRPAALRSNERKLRARILSVCVAAVVLPALAFGWRQHELAVAILPLGPVSSIIVAHFENKTGDPVFDSMLTPAFTIQLQQSPVLNIVSPEHLRQSLQYLGQPADAPLTSKLAREIGVREGIKAYLAGTIATLGTTYLVSATAINPENGDSIASAEAEATNKDRVLDALSSVARTIRNKLGESLDSIHKLDTPLGQATTPSLEAFRAFALGDVDHDRNREVPDAEGHYRQALALDPKFAMAWARLGAVYVNTGQDGKAVDCIKRAFELSSNLSERERFYIAGHYHSTVTGDIQKTIDTLELAGRTYPGEKGYFNNLADAQIQVGRLDDALVSAGKALELSPESALSNANMISVLTQLDRFPEALQFAAKMKKLGITDTSNIANFYAIDALTGDTDGMARNLAAAQGREDENSMTTMVAILQEYFGKYAEADRTWRHGAEQCAAQQALDAQASALLSRLAGRRTAGLSEDAAPEIKAALALDSSKPTLLSAASVAALYNLPDIARPLMNRLAQDYPDDTLINKVVLPCANASLALNAQQPKEALKVLAGSEPYDLMSPTAYLRGLSYLELQNGPDAIDAFRRATRYRGAAIISLSQDYVQAQLGLARALALTDDKAAAQKAYETVFDIWKHADATLPQLIAAKQEYAVLRAVPVARP